MTTENVFDPNNMKPDTPTMQEFMLSGDPKKAMQEMMETIDSLQNVYREENDALQTADTKRFIALQERKIKAARDYQSGTQQIIKRSKEFKNLDPALRDQLLQKQEEFSEIASNNMQALKRMKNGLERLNDRVIGAARKAAQKQNVNYRDNGNLIQNDRRVSIGVNESA